MFFLFVVCAVVLVVVIIYLILNKSKFETNDGDVSNSSLITNDRLECIKSKYKNTENIIMPKQATKKDVEDFYNSQKDNLKE